MFRAGDCAAARGMAGSCSIWRVSAANLASLCLSLTASLLLGCSQSQAPPVAESVLRRGNGGEPGTLDPQRAEDVPALTILTDLYEGLTTETARGELTGGAAREWVVSADGRTIVFHLRSKLRWSNGDALTAPHFAAGLRRAIDPRTAAPNAQMLSAIRRIEAPAADRLELQLSRPDPALPAILALPIAAPRHPSATDDAARTPVNGAYRMQDWQPHQSISLDRNEHYRNAASVVVARITYLPVEDLGTELRMYRSNLLDITSEIPNAQVGWVRENLAQEFHSTPLLATYSYAVNFARLPADTARRLRTALSLAVDREMLVARVTGAGEKAAFGWVPDGFPGYRPARYSWAAQDATARVAYARSELAQAKQVPDHLKLCTDSSENHRRTAVAIAAMWREALGIELQIQELEWKAFLAARAAPGDCDLMRLGWSADYLDPGGYLEIFASQHPQNTLHYSSPRFDELMQQARLAVDTSVRMRTLQLAESQLLADGAVIPLFFRVSKRLAKPNVQGEFSHPLGRAPSQYISLLPPP